MAPESIVKADKDLKLVRKALGRDPHSVDVLLQRLRCVPRMLSHKNAKVGGPFGIQELEDLAQDTVLAIWKRLDRFTGQGPLETWVYRFCFLEFMARLRSLGRRPQLLGEASQSLVEPEQTPRHIQYEDVYRSLDDIGPPGASVVRMKHFERMTFDEIATRLEISSNTAKTWYYRTLPKLRQRLHSRVHLKSAGESA